MGPRNFHVWGRMVHSLERMMCRVEDRGYLSTFSVTLRPSGPALFLSPKEPSLRAWLCRS